MTLPSFLGLGALKAGTTSVHELLAGHRQIAMPEHTKELMFFDRYWDRGVDWYQAQFAHADGRTAGEISPNYLFDPACPARIASVIPAARLFAVVRDPVARAWSQYVHFAREQGYRGDFDTFLAEHDNAVTRGLYAEQLRRYLDWFPPEALLVLQLEELVAHPQPIARALLTHLGVDPALPVPEIAQKNRGELPAWQGAWTVGRRVARWLYDHDLGRVVSVARSLGVRELLIGSGRAKPAGPSPETRARLAARYEEDQRALAPMLLRVTP